MLPIGRPNRDCRSPAVWPGDYAPLSLTPKPPTRQQSADNARHFHSTTCPPRARVRLLSPPPAGQLLLLFHFLLAASTVAAAATHQKEKKKKEDKDGYIVYSFPFSRSGYRLLHSLFSLCQPSLVAILSPATSLPLYQSFPLYFGSRRLPYSEKCQVCVWEENETLVWFLTLATLSVLF